MAHPEFKTPQGYIVPEGLNEGETFEDIATFKLKSNGQVCITKMGDSPIQDEGSETKDDEPADLGTATGMESRLTTAYRNR